MVPDSPGSLKEQRKDTLLARYNDLESVEALIAEHGPNFAAIIIEPVAGNMGCIPPSQDFYNHLSSLYRAWHSVNI